MNTQIESMAGGIRVTGEMTVYSAGQIKQPLLDALDGGSPNIAVDLSCVSEFDTAGLQLLLLAHREALTKGANLQIGATSSIVHETLSLCGALWLVTDAPKVRGAP